MRVVIFWVLSLTTLLCCFLVWPTHHNTQQAEPQSIVTKLKVEPTFFYYTNEKYHANVAGQLNLEIKTDTFIENITQFDLLVIDGLEIDSNSSISLKWVADQNTHEIQLNTNPTSINPINFDASTTHNLTEMYLQINSNFELGVQPKTYKEVSFSDLYFDNSNNHSNLSIELNEWFDFTPIKFNSINGYSSTDNLHFKSLILKLTFWVLCNVILFMIIQVSGFQLILSFSLAWLIMFLPFANNFINQNHQIRIAYPLAGQFLNPQDIKAYEMAQVILADLESITDINTESQKFVIVGTNNFYHLRLFHHLETLNVAINTDRLKLQLQEKTDTDYIFILVNKRSAYCKMIKLFEKSAEVIAQGDQFCLVRKS